MLALGSYQLYKPMKNSQKANKKSNYHLKNAYQQSSTNRAMDDVQQMSIRADPTTRENKEGKKKKIGILLSVVFFSFFSLKKI